MVDGYLLYYIVRIVYMYKDLCSFRLSESIV